MKLMSVSLEQDLFTFFNYVDNKNKMTWYDVAAVVPPILAITYMIYIACFQPDPKEESKKGI